MKVFIYRLTGSALIAAAVFGLVLTLAAGFHLWRIHDQLRLDLESSIGLISRSLHTTADNLQVVDDTLVNAKANLDQVKASTKSVAKTINETRPIVQQMSGLMGTDLPKVVDNTRQSLDAAVSGAKLVDDTLRIVSKIPGLGARYTPTVPLQTTVQDVSDSLKGLPDSFQKVQQGMNTTESNLEIIRAGVEQLSEELNLFDTNITDAQGAVHKYQATVNELITRVDRVQAGAPGWLDGAYFIGGLVWLWLLLLQVSLFAQGLELLSRSS